jgi:hypothetical protein
MMIEDYCRVLMKLASGYFEILLNIYQTGGTMLEAGRSGVRFPMRALDFSIHLILPAALLSTQPLTEMSTRNIPGGKGRPVRRADNLTAICEPIV